MFKQLDEFASRPGKAVLFRETGAEHRSVDEKSAEGGFLEVRVLCPCLLLHWHPPYPWRDAQSEVGHPDASKVRGCQCRQRAESDIELAVRLNDFVHGIAASCVAYAQAAHGSPAHVRVLCRNVGTRM